MSALHDTAPVEGALRVSTRICGGLLFCDGDYTKMVGEVRYFVSIGT